MERLNQSDDVLPVHDRPMTVLIQESTANVHID